jgi:hypothetical protein
MGEGDRGQGEPGVAGQGTGHGPALAGDLDPLHGRELGQGVDQGLEPPAPDRPAGQGLPGQVDGGGPGLDRHPAQAGLGREEPADAGEQRPAAEQLADGGRGHHPGVRDRVPFGGQVAAAPPGPEVVDGQVELAAAEVGVVLLDRRGPRRPGRGGAGRRRARGRAGVRPGRRPLARAGGQAGEHGDAGQTRRQASHPCRPLPPNPGHGSPVASTIHHAGRDLATTRPRLVDLRGKGWRSRSGCSRRTRS